MDALSPAIMTAGLGGTVIALIVAAATNNWKPKVVILLALRLAIGWHFLFEGLHKIHSHIVGPTDTSRPFTSEPYFTVAEGPFGEHVRKTFLGDPDRVIEQKATPQADKLAGFAKRSIADQAALCPDIVARPLAEAAAAGLPEAEAEVAKLAATVASLEAEGKQPESAKLIELRKTATITREKAAALEQNATKAEAEAEKQSARAILAADEADKEKYQSAKDRAATAGQAARDARVAALQAKATAEFAEKQATEADPKKKLDEAKKKLIVAEGKVNDLKNDGAALKAAYARWLYGVDRRDAKVKNVSTDIPQSVPERLAHIALLKSAVAENASKQGEHLGSGYGIDVKKAAAARADWNAAKTDLANDADGFIADLVKYAGGPPAEPAIKTIKAIDQLTMYTITAIGAGLLLGLFTRLWCFAGAGFLMLTYLSHPTVPWLPLPPGTEGNPLFINKNLVEALAMLALMCYPTGRWLGLDALIAWVIFRKPVEVK